MNKSTPISQLPNTQNFVNDQQRSMVTQAQQAIQNSTFPQNTQLSPDITNDDDPTIQEVLNQFNNNDQSQLLAQAQAQAQAQLLAQAQAQSQAQMQMQAQAQDQANQLYSQMQAQAQVQNNIIPQIIPPSSTILGGYITNFTNDIKLVIAIFILYIVIEFLPIETVLGKYIAIDKIPYHKVLLRALLFAGLFIVLKKFIL
jgi:hypothetical protein